MSSRLPSITSIPIFDSSNGPEWIEQMAIYLKATGPFPYPSGKKTHPADLADDASAEDKEKQAL